jgi:hypothetical protein
MAQPARFTQQMSKEQIHLARASDMINRFAGTAASNNIFPSGDHRARGFSWRESEKPALSSVRHQQRGTIYSSHQLAQPRFTQDLSESEFGRMFAYVDKLFSQGIYRWASQRTSSLVPLRYSNNRIMMTWVI